MSPASNCLEQQPLQDGHTVTSPTKKIFRMLAVVAVVLAGILVVTVASHPASRDYLPYWSAGKLLVHHSNPYSRADVLALEKTQGYLKTNPLIMLNPPWALFLAAPLGFSNVREGLFLWTLAAVGCVLLFARLLNISSKDRAFAFVFAPALACIFSSQSSPFLLLGFALFLRFHRNRPFLAGASLLLMAIKPHLFLIFWAVLLVDCIYRRRLAILAGGLSALIAGTAFSMCFDPHVWQHYFTMLHGYGIEQGSLSTASMLFRTLIDVRAFWLLFVPSAFAVLWGLWYYARWRQVWDWRVHGMLLMLVTILVSPYGWFSDEIVLLPSIAFALACSERRRYSIEILLAINSVALLIVMVAHANLSSRAYLWTPLAWLAWFLYAAHGSGRRSQSSLIQRAELTKVEKTA